MAPEVLAELVVPPGESGALAAGLRRSEDSGAVDAAARAEETLDPDDYGSDLTARGYTGGEELVYVADPSAPQGAVLEISTTADAFRSPRPAAAFLTRQVASQKAARGATLVGGIRYLDVKVSDAAGPAEEAKLIRVRARARGVVFYPTLVLFRRGRIVGTVVITRKGRPPDDDDVERLAERLDAKVESHVGG